MRGKSSEQKTKILYDELKNRIEKIMEIIKMEYKIDLKDLDSPFTYARFDELPKDIVIELLIRQLKRLNKISEYVLELKQNAPDEMALDKILDIIKKG